VAFCCFYCLLRKHQLEGHLVVPLGYSLLLISEYYPGYSMWPLAIGDLVTYITTSKTLARNASVYAEVLTPTLVICFPLLPLGSLLSFVLSHPRFKPPEVSVSPGIGSSRVELSLCLAFFPVFNLYLIDYASYFHSPLIHFLKISIGVPCYRLFYFPF